MARRIITLTTDFGHTDHYVGAMKGVILSIAPATAIVDITHSIAPYGVSEGAFVIAQAYPYYPAGTIHVVVVDPGVGSSRRPILVEAGDQFFIGPDNGVLSMIYSEQPAKVRELNNTSYFRETISTTFHGRDIFAPVAAHLAAGAKPARAGKVITDYLRPTFEKPSRYGKRIWTGTILKVDHFGNLITNLHATDFPQIADQSFQLAVGTRLLQRLAASYASEPPGEPFVIIGSSGYLEVSCNQQSAARLLGCASGAPVELTLGT